MFCPKCGTNIHEASQFCVKCGTRLGEYDAGRPAVSVAPPTGVAPGVAATSLYAGFWRRVAAYLVDYGLVLIVAVVLGIVLASVGFTEAQLNIAGTLVWLVGSWLYYAGMESSERQATIGKLALGIKVTDLAGQRISFWRATARLLGMILSSLTLGIGYVMAGFTKRRQALHDKVAGTLVVRKAATAEALATNPAAGAVSAWVIVLLILVGSIPIVGILAAIAIPAYQDYTIRSQVVAGLVEAAAYKAAVAEAVANDRTWEEIDSATLELSTEAASPYLQSIEIVSGNVVLTYGGSASEKIAGAQLVLVPGLTDGGDLVWTCGYAAASAGVELALEEHASYTNVEGKYLPSSCRS